MTPSTAMGCSRGSLLGWMVPSCPKWAGLRSTAHPTAHRTQGCQARHKDIKQDNDCFKPHPCVPLGLTGACMNCS